MSKLLVLSLLVLSTLAVAGNTATQVIHFSVNIPPPPAPTVQIETLGDGSTTSVCRTWNGQLCGSNTKVSETLGVDGTVYTTVTDQ